MTLPIGAGYGQELLATCHGVYGSCGRPAERLCDGEFRQHSITRQFEAVEINPNFRYWYLNQENNRGRIALASRSGWPLECV